MAKKVHPGTISADEWLQKLDEYQHQAGWGAIPARQDVAGRPLRQWIERMRRMSNAGHLPLSLALGLARYGIRLAQDDEKSKATNQQADASFQKNLVRLNAWIEADCRARQRKAAQISYQISRTDPVAGQCYTFLEHMRLKFRQNLLAGEHYWHLLNLPLVINDGSVAQWMNGKPSIRKGALGSEISIEQIPPLREMRVLEERAAWDGERGEIYVAGTGTLSVVFNDGQLETTCEGFVVNTTTWRRDMTRGRRQPTLVYLHDLGCYGVLSLYQALPLEDPLSSLRSRLAAETYARWGRENESKPGGAASV